MKNVIENLNLGCSRRDFLRVSAGAMAAVAATSIPLSSEAKSIIGTSKAITVRECIDLSPVAMADKSVPVQKSYDYLLKTAGTIQDASLRKETLEILKNPAPRLTELYGDSGSREKIKTQLVDAGYVKASAAIDEFLPPSKTPTASPIPFYAAPGSGYASHHSYPGGLATHVGANVKAALGFYEGYRDTYDYKMNRDVIIVAQALHDLHKPWVFQWQESGASRTEYPLAGAGSHHVLSLAELIHRKFPAEVIVAQACAHTHPGNPTEEKSVIDWLTAAAMLAQQDPIEFGLLASDGKTLPLPRQTEGFITHLGDHDFVLSVPEAKWMIAKLGEIAQRDYGMNSTDLNTARFYSFRNYVFSQATIEKLYMLWTKEGEGALSAVVKNIVLPA